MQSYQADGVKVGTNKGAPRVWLEGRRIQKAGFAPGTRYNLKVGKQHLTLTIADNGMRIVSTKKRKDDALAVIDINSHEALDAFAGLERVRIVIKANEIHVLPLATQKKATERLERITAKLRAGTPLRVGSLCHGGGVLSLALHQGMSESGVDTELAFANDIDPICLEQAATHNNAWTRDTQYVAAPMQEVMADDYLLKQMGSVDILEAGIPCVGASLAGRAKKGLNMAEADPHAGHLVVAFLGIIQALQPAVVVLENVVPYMRTASAHQIRYMLRDWGYQVQETVLEGLAYGALEDRKRMALVAVTRGLHFDLDSLNPPAVAGRTLGDVLEDIPEDAPCWSAMDYLRVKEERDKKAGKGFRMQIVGPADTHVGTVGADYQKNRSTEPKVRHPSKGDALLRLLTPAEHARIKGVSETLIDGMPATRAHHLLGNSICAAPFTALGRSIGLALRAFAASRQLPMAA